MNSRYTRILVRILHFATICSLLLVAGVGAVTPAAASTPAEIPADDIVPPPAPTLEPAPDPVLPPPEPSTPLTDVDAAIPGNLAKAEAVANAVDGTERASLSASGGAVSFLDGRVTVIAEPGDLGEGVQLVLKSQEITKTAAATAVEDEALASGGVVTDPNVHPHAVIQFTLEAIGSGGKLVEGFAKPVQIVVDMRGLPGATGEGEWFLAYQDEKDSYMWHGVEPTVYDRTGLITINTVHFSNWAGGQQPAGWEYQWEPPTVSTFSGAATYKYPIEVPPGRNGLTPNIDISYSSRNVDGLVSSDNLDQGPLGLGWSFNTITIAREGIKISNPGGGNKLYHKEWFSLIINGQGYKLHRAGELYDNPVRYYATDAPQIFIERRVESGVGNRDGIYWVVKTPDGTVYRLGYDQNSIVGQHTSPNNRLDFNDHVGHDQYYSIIRWQVDTVTDVYGNQIQYDYKYDSVSHSYGGANATTVYTDRGRPLQIRYNFDTLATNPLVRVSGNYHSLIQFDTDGYRIDWIKLYHGGLPTDNPAANPYRVIALTLSEDIAPSHDPACPNNSVTTKTVAAIQEQNYNNSASLPATTFTYDSKGHAYGSYCYYFSHLDTVNNGYGGKVDFDYTADGRRSTGMTYVVTKTKTWDGLHTSSANVTYTYYGPCYDQTGTTSAEMGEMPGASNCPYVPAGSDRNSGALIGFSQVTRLVEDYGGADIKAYISNFYKTWDKMGRPISEELRAGGATGTVLQQQNWTTVVEDIPDTANKKTTFAYTSVLATTTYFGGQAANYRTDYFYDRNYQGNAQYGNLTRTQEYDAAGNVYRTTVSGFYPNITDVDPSDPFVSPKWIVNKPGYVNWFTGSNTAAWPVSSVWYGYDGQYTYSGTPITGALTAERYWTGDKVAGQLKFVDVTYGYDAYGNRTSETTYTNLGTEGGLASTGAMTTTATYDSTFHLYLKTLANAAVPAHTTTYNYYGIDLALNATNGPFYGLMQSVIDPNNQATTFTYDWAGRLKEIFRPGDTYGTITYQYVDAYSYNGLTGSRILETHREDAATSGAVWVLLHFYDGLGRKVQTREETINGSQQSVANTVYDALGQVINSYVPGLESWNWDYSPSTNWSTWPKTTSAYDALGRVTQVTDTGGYITKYAYSGRKTGVLDANGHQRISEVDSLGRLIKVYEYTTSQSQPDFNASIYATTTYAYDVKDQLTSVTDASGNVTTINYNILGQKTSMIDPDMGKWSYTYDLAGNLETQTDARGQVLWFKYDNLNRLTERRTTNSSGTLLAQNTYDQGTYGIGHRTTMTDTSGATTWAFDLRGRLASEAHTVTGAGTFGFSYLYDSSDRLTQVTYPTNETVSFTYDNGWHLTGVNTSTSVASYASGMTYNALDQLKQMTVGPSGNGVTTRYDYYGDGDPWGTPKTYRLWRARTDKSGTDLFNIQHGYDGVGNISTTYLQSGGETYNYAYDGLDRLITVTGSLTQNFSYTSIGNFVSMAGVSQTYPAASPTSGCESGTPGNKPHAVAQAGTGATPDLFRYDCNGNMVTRVEAGQTITTTQTFDIENHLTSVVAGSQTTTYVYDGDGNRVKETVGGGDTTVMIGKWYEKNINTGVETLYYYAGDQRIALRKNNVVSYLLTDHLGSTSVTLDPSGTKVGELRYYPFGGTRYTWGTTPTDLQFTGQREEANVGLVDYGARFYKPGVGRFIQPDTIVPAPGNPQTLNRYAYAYNNPLKYSDPTGHFGSCPFETCPILPQNLIKQYQGKSWAQLPETVQNNLAQADWDTETWNAEYGGGASAQDVAGTLQDPAVYVAAAAGGAHLAPTVGAAFEAISWKAASACAQIAACWSSIGAAGSAVAKSSADIVINTPYGPAHQEMTTEALEARAAVEGGATLYKIGTFGESTVLDAQFWALDHPLTANYAQLYGVPPNSVSAANFIESGVLRPGAEFITRTAPGFGPNPGGGIEVVVYAFGVRLTGFHMP